MELKYYTILTSPQYNNPSLLVKDWNKENYPFGFGGVNHDGTECILEQEQEVYLKEDVDEAIAELKAKLENVQASMYADVVDANMENRRLKHSLYNLRAVYANMMQERYIECKTDGCVHRINKWIEVDCLDYNVHKITDSIVRKYAEHLADYVRDQLTRKYALNKFSTFGVRLRTFAG